MTHTTRTGSTALRRALRREVPSTVGLLTDAHDFAAMRRYRSFTFDDHTTYLRETERLLRTLATTGGHTTVALFDPEDYAAYCTETGLDPDTPASRSRYTSETAATGARLTYTGQPIDELVPALVDTAARHATRAYAAALLADAGPCAECGQDIGRAAYDRATRAVLRLLDRAGPGRHHLVCSLPAGDDHLLAVLHTARGAAPPTALDSADATEFLTVLAAGLARRSPGGLVLRTTSTGAPDRLHGWRLDHGRLVPLTEAEVFDAYCTDAHTGEPLPPEPGVTYRPGFDLAPDDGRPTHD
ncbi:hypothetical protein BJP40_19010 [Streptomyces sp. CC53]|uniref:hypothetical protein n=1 Tax=unclassified Streptomyces TaxID=2593676 RepID=UPI0008DDB4DD|nr:MULTISPECIES: hypothetical protein [unclassified Streptomyces]OII64856.1 hypothetical protein BJP40_19010 [Streptomyces sp. CC53]